jgi:hypothetical protein
VAKRHVVGVHAVSRFDAISFHEAGSAHGIQTSPEIDRRRLEEARAIRRYSEKYQREILSGPDDGSALVGISKDARFKNSL